MAPRAEQKQLYQIAWEHIQENMALLRPGLSFAELTQRDHRLPEAYRALRYGVLAHGIGLCDEYPSVRYPEDQEQHGYSGCLEAGMTLCVEAMSGPWAGVRA